MESFEEEFEMRAEFYLFGGKKTAVRNCGEKENAYKGILTSCRKTTN